MEVKGPSGPSKTEKTSKTKKSGSSGAAGAFSALIGGADETGGAAGVGTTHAVTGLDAILMAQSIDGDEARKAKKQAVNRGNDILDSLNELRVGLLTGTLSGNRITRLRNLIDQHRGMVDDPKLIQILDEIDLRAAVELAKIERE